MEDSHVLIEIIFFYFLKKHLKMNNFRGFSKLDQLLIDGQGLVHQSLPMDSCLPSTLYHSDSEYDGKCSDHSIN